MKQVEIKNIIASLEASFNGEPWFGDSVMSKLNSIQFKLINEQINDSNSIAKLVLHIIQWRIFTIEKLKENKNFDIELNSESDWPDTTIENEIRWKKLLEKLKQTQKELLELITKLDDSFLYRKTSGTDYTNGKLLEGIIQHDIYHLGQIGLIKSQIAKKHLK